MRSKTPLILIELLVMLLIFALVAGVCIRAFLWANRVSARSAQRDLAVIAAQNAAELTKYYAGDFRTAAAEQGGNWDGSCWRFTSGDCHVTVTPLTEKEPYLGSAHICAQAGSDAPAVEFAVTWQEVSSHEE